MRQNCNTYKANKFQTPGAKPFAKDNFVGRRTDRTPVFELIVHGLSERTTDSDLRKVFEAYCPCIGKAKIVVDPITEQSKRFGFISYYKEVDLKMVLSQMGPESTLQVEGSTWRVERAKEKPRQVMAASSRTSKQSKSTKFSGAVSQKPSNNKPFINKFAPNKMQSMNKTPFLARKNPGFKLTSGAANKKSITPPPRLMPQQHSGGTVARPYRNPNATFPSVRDAEPVPPCRTFNQLASQYSRNAVSTFPAAVRQIAFSSAHTSSTTSPEIPITGRIPTYKRPREFEQGECDEQPPLSEHAYHTRDSDHDSTTGDDLSSAGGGEQKHQTVMWKEHYEPY